MQVKDVQFTKAHYFPSQNFLSETYNDLIT